MEPPSASTIRPHGAGLHYDLLYRLSDAITSTDMEAALQRALEEIIEVLDGEYGVMASKDGECRLLRADQSKREAALRRMKMLALNDEPKAAALRAGKLIVLQPTAEEFSDARETGQQEEGRANLCIPITAKGAGLGVFIIYNARQQYTDDLGHDFLALAGRQIGLALAISQPSWPDHDIPNDEDSWRTIAGAFPLAMFIVRRANGVVLQANEQFGNSFGIAQEAVDGANLEACFTDPSAWRQALDNLENTAGVDHRELPLRKGEGPNPWIALWLRPLTYHGEAAVLGVAADISARKRAEASLHRAHKRLAEAEARYRELYELAPDLYFSTYEDGKIFACNQTCVEVLGYRKEELIGLTHRELVPPEYHVETDTNMKRIAEGVGEKVVERFLVRRDGSSFPVELKVSPQRDAAGNLTYTHIIVRDITERKKAEAELRMAKDALEQANRELGSTNRQLEDAIKHANDMAQQADSASRLKGQFLANMSHEIRTPMNGIIGMTDLALDTDLTPEQREYLELIQSSADSLLTIINDILDFSKIEAGKLELHPRAFNLHTTLNDVVSLLRSRAQGKGLRLSCQIDDDVPADVVGDSGRVRQILMNLVTNAIKFTSHGEVAIGVRVESRREQNVRLHFTVRDTGIGIDQEQQANIFEAFAQADGSTTRKYGGTGLGLAICSQLVAMMEGSISVESEPDEGATFHFTVRLQTSDESASGEKPSPRPELEQVRILVLDGHAANRRILEEALASWGTQPTILTNPAVALETLRQAANVGQPYDVLITDALFSEMDGFELANRIKSDPAISQLRIMMFSSDGGEGESLRCRELGIESLIVQPFKLTELFNELCRVLNPLARNAPCHPHANLNILLAEDNVVNQKLAVRLLEKAGHRVVVANNGRAAIEELRKKSFDLVLMDVQMPVMGGFEATAVIREEERRSGAHIPIVAMTAHAMEDDRRRCLEAGMDDYLSKPITSKALLELISTIAAPAGNATVTP